MNFPDYLLPAGWYWTGLMLCALRLDPGHPNCALGGAKGAGPLNVWLGTCVVLMSLWSIMTGMAITLMAVYKPLWLSTFDDSRYLKRNK